MQPEMILMSFLDKDGNDVVMGWRTLKIQLGGYIFSVKLTQGTLHPQPSCGRKHSSKTCA